MAFLLSIPFEERGVARTHPELTYSQERGHWVYTGKTLPEDLKQYLPGKYTWGDFQTLRGEPSPYPTYKTGAVTLREDQAQDRDKLLTAFKHGAKEVLIASGTGVGKTYTALATAHALPGSRRILIVCPVSAIPGWRRSIQTMGDQGKHHAVLSYGSWKHLLKAPSSLNSPRKRKGAAQKKVSALSHATQGVSRVAWDVIIFDEAHMLGNPESQRTRASNSLIEGSPHSRVIKISATIGVNPLKLAHLHRGLKPVLPAGAPKQVLTQKAWVKYLTSLGVKIDKWGNWVYNSQDLEMVNKWFFESKLPWVVRSTPDWGETKRYLTPIDLSPAEKVAYHKSWKEFLQVQKSIEGDYRSSRISASERRQKGLAAIIRYRQKAGLLKAPHVAEYVNDLLENENLQVAISAEFMGTVEALQQAIKFPCAIFTGQNTGTREQERLAFQRGDKRVIIFSASESFDLHESAHDANGVPRVQVCAEPSWSALMMKQKEGRTNRDGVHAPIFYMAAADTVDERIIEKCMEGFVSMDKMMGDPESIFSD